LLLVSALQASRGLPRNLTLKCWEAGKRGEFPQVIDFAKSIFQLGVSPAVFFAEIPGQDDFRSVLTL
jgi:hypothetical protein